MIRNNLLLFRKFVRNSLNYFHQNIHSNLLKFIKSITQSNHNQIYLSIFIFLTMTHDSESVESRTTRLLRSIANKRVFLLSFNVSAESQNVAISWNIKIEEQLRQWALDQSNKIIKMLNKLRNQQDMILKCNEHWIVLQVEHTQRLKQLKINCTTMNILEETNIQLQKTMLKLKEKQRSADQLRSRQSIESRSTTNHLSQQNIESHAFIKNHTQREMSTNFTSFENENH